MPSSDSYDTTRIVTIPNAISALRVALVPVFFWLAITQRANAAIAVLTFSSISDYVDGALARRWHQTSPLGAMLDPAADRLFIASTVLALAVNGTIGWWLVGLILARELVLVPTVPLLRRAGYRPLRVHPMGKAATLNLLYAFPMLLGATAWRSSALLALAWAFAGWGLGLYWWSGLAYLRHTLQLVRGQAADPGVR